jgi:FAD/FMN-containing dehydrogenase
MHPVAAPADLATLAATFKGRISAPDDADYETLRRVFDARYDRRPALIVRPVDTADVARAVLFARAAGLPIAVRAGGHSVAGYGTADGALVINLSEMRGVEIDPERRVGRAQGGVTAGEYTTAAAAHGLVTPFGDTATVGLGGLTLGGGMGWLTRKHGLTIDSLLAAEVVTAEGEILTASASSHPELFWAIRGGGGNFGVVTAFEYRLHPLGMVTGGMLLLPATPETIAGCVRESLAAPDELTMIAMVMRIPPMPFVPESHHGALGLLILPVHAGDLEAGQAAMAPFRALAEPIADMVAPMPYPAMYDLLGEEPPAAGMAVRSLMLDGLSLADAEAIVDRMGTPDAAMSMFQVRVLGGAAARVPAEATAYAHRERPVLAVAIAPYMDLPQADQALAWATAAIGDLALHGQGVYSNFLEDEGEARVRAAYPGGAYERLVEAKRQYDPQNLFRFNQNIQP